MLGMIETMNLLGIKLLLRTKDYGAFTTYPHEVFRVYMKLVGFDRWWSKALLDIFPDSRGERIIVEHLPGEGISTPIEHLACLAFMTRALDPKVILEIGTFRGRSALTFALNSPDDCRVYTLDLGYEERVNLGDCYTRDDREIIRRSITGVDYKDSEVDHKITQLYGDSTEFDFTPFYGMVDLVFVDGAHNYTVVLSDTRNALRMVKKGGLIIWDDFGFFHEYNDIIRAVLTLVPGEEIIQVEGTELALYFAR